MTETEKAIQAFEISSENPMHEGCAMPYYAVVEPAFETALAALREKQERSKGCEYCTQGEEMAYGQDSLNRTGYIYLDGNLLTADLYSESMAVAVCFCPICGKRLEVKHE